MSIRRWKSHLTTALMMLCAFAAVQAWQTRDVPSGAAPDLALTLVQADGRVSRTTLSAWRAAHPGQPVALHVWAEWCPICRAEEGSVTALAQAHPVLTVAMRSGASAAVAGVLRQRQLPWLAAVDAEGDAAAALGVRAVPAFWWLTLKGTCAVPVWATPAGWACT